MAQYEPGDADDLFLPNEKTKLSKMLDTMSIIPEPNSAIVRRSTGRYFRHILPPAHLHLGTIQHLPGRFVIRTYRPDQ